MHATLVINKKGQAHFPHGPMIRLPIVTNETRRPASEALDGAIVYNLTTGRLQVCTGDRWRTVIMSSKSTPT